MKGSRDFTLLAAGQGFSWFGSGFQTVALPLAVLAIGGGAGELGVVIAANVIGLLAGLLLGGVFADRRQPLRVMAASDLVRLIAAASIAAVLATGAHSVVLLCCLTVVGAVASAFFQPAMSALKPMLVAADDLPRANATLNLLQTICTVAGPAMGGITIALLGPAAGFAVDAASYLVSVVTVLAIRARVERQRSDRFLHDLSAGWQQIRQRDWLTAGVFAATAYHVANGILLVLVPIIAVRSLGGATATGFVYAAEGLGGVLGALVAMRWRPARMLRAGWFALLLAPVWVLAFVWPGTLTAVLATGIAAYGGLGYFSVGWESTIQQEIPHRFLARVTSWDMLTSFAALPIGSLLAGPLSAALGLQPLLIGCAALMLLCALAPLAVRGSRNVELRAASAPTSVTEAPHPA